ncbi:PEP-CTERM sorting domain-containing protein [Geobacter sp.]|uniref:PEP-CTERM sorting domain-containing protein n=1 Tax=Geobacter sp. TaxID=46610 RepID=UPI0027B8A5C7|nr:PEP-CTERM sorting domain-containing protein [Geobacter sp.]
MAKTTKRLISGITMIFVVAVLGLSGEASAITVSAVTLKELGVSSMTGEVDGASQGFRFQANSPLQVTSLGIIDSEGDGFVNTHEVGLWSDSGVLLAMSSFTPTSSGTLRGYFRFKNITPVYLSSGDIFRLAASQVFHDEDRFDSDAIPIDTHSYSPEISFLDGVGAMGGGLLFPDIVGFVNLGFPPLAADVVGGNFEFEVVPEPSTAGLFAAGMVLLVIARRRKVKIHSTRQIVK